MNVLTSIFSPIVRVLKPVIYLPLLNLMVFAYHYIPDIGIVIILLTILSRLILLPSFHRSIKNQKLMMEMQPKLDAIKLKYKNDKDSEMKAIMELYKEHEFNPLSPCLPLVLQLPILVALYQVFIRGLNGQALQGLYKFVPDPGHINAMFLHFLDLSKPSWEISLAAAIFQYIQSWMIQPKVKSADATARMLQLQTLYFFPALYFIIGLRVPAGLTLYWTVGILFMIAQQYYIIWKDAKEAEINLDAGKI
jgi:YidC/Oxa1 family membrane protein insertase